MPDFDLNQWLQGLELSDEQRTAVNSALSTEKNQQQLKESFLRQQDYSKRMNELAAKRREQEENYSRQFGELATWKTEAEAELARVEAARLQAEARAKALSAAAEEYGLDTSQVVVPTPQPNMPTKPEAQKPSEDYTKLREEFTNELGTAPLVNAAMYEIAAEYQELTGKPFRGMTDFVSEALKERKSLSDLAEEKFDFTKLRQEKVEAAQKERDARLIAEAEARVRSELQLPTPRPDFARAPIFTPRTPPADGQAPPPARPGAGVEAAVAAFNQGTYRPS